MPQSSPEFKAIMGKLREVWATTDEVEQAYLLRELEALIYRYQETLRGA
jgi:hypothetical protein